MEQFENVFFQFILKNKKNIIRVFQCFYALYLFFLIYAVHAVYSLNDSYISVISNAGNLGKLALIFFCLAILSGILRRFGVLKKISSGLILIRRHLGITTFLFAFGHYMILRGVPLFSGQLPFMLPAAFELFGVLALLGLTLLFLTSNDVSVRKLGRNWSLLHKLVYIIVWLIFLHVALQSIGIWTIVIGIFAVIELVSLMMSAIKKRNISTPTPTA